MKRYSIRLLLLAVLLIEAVVFFSKPKINLSKLNFSRPEPAQESTPAKVIEIPLPVQVSKEEEAFSLQLELLGTAIGNIKDPIAFIKDLQSGKQGIYRLGSKIYDAKIIKIVLGEVVFDINGRKESLKLSKRAMEWAKLKGKSPAITSVNGDNVIISRNGLSNDLMSVEEAIRTLKFKPVGSVGGTSGLMVEGVSEGSLAAQAGMRDKDIVTVVNNQKVDSYQKALQVFAKTLSQPEVKVKLLRDGQPKNISYRFEK